MPAAALVIAPTPPPMPVDVGVPDEASDLPVLVFPVELVVGRVNGPLVPEAGGVTTVPVVELTKIGGFNPVTKPEVAFADFVGPVRPMLFNKNLPCAADAVGM